VLSGSTLNIDSGATIANSGTATGFGQTQGDVLDDLNTTGANAAADEVLVGTGAGALSWESGDTLRGSIGAGGCYLIGQPSATLNNKTGDGTAYQIEWDTEVVDRTGDLSSTTVTIPTTGAYLVAAIARVSGVLSSHNTGDLRIVSSGSQDYILWEGDPGTNLGSGSGTSMQGAQIVNFTAAETFTIQLTVTDSSRVVDLVSGAVGCRLCVWYLG
jgi:hypothetical protein